MRLPLLLVFVLHALAAASADTNEGSSSEAVEMLWRVGSPVRGYRPIHRQRHYVYPPSHSEHFK